MDRYDLNNLLIEHHKIDVLGDTYGSHIIKCCGNYLEYKTAYHLQSLIIGATVINNQDDELVVSVENDVSVANELAFDEQQLNFIDADILENLELAKETYVSMPAQSECFDLIEIEVYYCGDDLFDDDDDIEYYDRYWMLKTKSILEMIGLKMWEIGCRLYIQDEQKPIFESASEAIEKLNATGLNFNKLFESKD